MKSSSLLGVKLRPKVFNLARLAMETGEKVSSSFHMEIENDEGIVGHYYLHGTNANKGNFQIEGTSAGFSNADGSVGIYLNLSYVWNDIIDPNYEYDTDKYKDYLAKIAGKIIPFIQPTPYSIAITWSDKALVQFDNSGTVVLMKGWPFEG